MSMTTVRIPDGGIFDLMVTRDVNGDMLAHPRTYSAVLIRQRGELLVATDSANNEVTPSLAVAIIERVPKKQGKIMGLRAQGQNADTFARQSWVMFPARVKELT